MKKLAQLFGYASFVAAWLFMGWHPKGHVLIIFLGCAAVGFTVVFGGTLVENLSGPNSRWARKDRDRNGEG